MKRIASTACLLAVAMMTTGAVKGDVPGAIAVPGATLIALVKAEGAQVYECRAGADGSLGWQFLEPVARLIENGREIGRHFAGPTWALDDGSSVVGKPTARAPSRTANDIPLLRLDVVSHTGNGRLSPVTTIQRLNTRGGTMAGPCLLAGVRVSVPYAADYAFLKAPSQ